METHCSKKISESDLKNEIIKMNVDIDALFNEVTDIKFAMEKSHFEVIMAIEPKINSDIEKKISACEKCLN